MSNIPMNPSVAWRTALFRMAMDLRLFCEPAVPMVEAPPWWLLTVSSRWLFTDSFESELMVPESGPTGRLRLLARRTMVATVRQ
jgi:hypothetical protein